MKLIIVTQPITMLLISTWRGGRELRGSPHPQSVHVPLLWPFPPVNPNSVNEADLGYEVIPYLQADH